MWNGVIRLVAIHNRVLTPEQIQQNFDAGVGEKFFLMFGVEHLTNINDSFVVFEAAQFDSYGYLFRKPFFISLDGTAAAGRPRRPRHARRLERRRSAHRPRLLVPRHADHERPRTRPRRARRC